METPGTMTLSKWRLNRPQNQNAIMGVILFCLPGIYLALTGLGAGGGGPDSLLVSVQVNSIVYGLFTLSGWLGGAILNSLKPKLTIAFGGLGYPVYVTGLWYFDKVGHDWFPYLGGVLLGLSAGCLWTGASYIAWSYAEEKDKGKYIAVQWAMTSFGGTVGALVAFGISVHETASTGVSNAVYGTFTAIMVFAVILALLLIQDPKNIIRDDGTHIAKFEKPSFSREVRQLKSLLTDWKMIFLMIPMFVAEMCLAVVTTLNGYYFNLRTRSLNNILFQFIMIPTAIGLSLLLDGQFIKSRRIRGLYVVGLVGVFTMAAAAGLVAWEKENHIVGTLPVSPDVDWTDNKFAGGCVLYMLWGIVYASYVVVVQYVVASLSNDPEKIAFYSGFSKGTSSLGLCISFVFDVESVTYFTQTIIQFVLYGVGTVIMLAVIFVFVKDTNYFAEDNVIVPHYIEEKMLSEGYKPHQKEVTVVDSQMVLDGKVLERNGL